MSVSSNNIPTDSIRRNNKDNDCPAATAAATTNDNNVMLRVPPFVPDQRVFATDKSRTAESQSQHPQLLYEAVVRKTHWTGQQWNFLVHYNGWNSRWDSWLDETNMFSDTPEVRARVLEQQQQQQQQQETKKRTRAQQATTTADQDDHNEQQQHHMNSASTSTNARPSSSSSSLLSRKKQRTVGQHARSRASSLPSYADYCELPFTLKTILVDDRDKIMRTASAAGKCNGLGCTTATARTARDRPLVNHYERQGASSSATARATCAPALVDATNGGGRAATATAVHNKEHWRPFRDVHDLPAQVTVRTVLDHFVKCKRKEAQAAAATAASSSASNTITSSGSDKDAAIVAAANEAEHTARAFVEELATLFDETLAVCLLYQPERAQHLAIQAHPKLSQYRKSELYGCEFLLRFLVRLPTLLEQAEAAAGGVDANKSSNHCRRKQVGNQLADLIVLLQKNRQSCFKAKYREPKDEELNEYEKAIRHGAAPVAMDE